MGCAGGGGGSGDAGDVDVDVGGSAGGAVDVGIDGVFIVIVDVFAFVVLMPPPMIMPGS